MLPPCVADATGRDFQVGPAAGQLASLDLVPWEDLEAGDTVRIFWRSAPYKGKFMLSGSGSAAHPIRVCGVKGPQGQRPVIDGNGATTRASLDYGHALFQSRDIIVVKQAASAPWTSYPQHLTIDGLELTGAYPTHSFTDTGGATVAYDEFGACLWIERGKHLIIRDNVIHDCTNGIFSKSTDDGAFAVTEDLLIQANSIYDCGVVGDDHEHGTYVQSVGVVYELNHYGPQRAGGGGSALKDRSAGVVVRYNRIEECARSLDLVEAEDFPSTALAEPRYRTTHVYGNLITIDVDQGVPVHYGGDHYGSSPGASWGEPIFRKGTLYFYHNTLVRPGNGGWPYLFQIPTTEEHLEVFNNVLWFSGTTPYKALRTGNDVGSSWTTGGTINLGVNWMNQGWVNHDANHPVPGPVTGAANVRTSSAAPIDLSTLVPLVGSGVIDLAQALPASLAAHPVVLEYTDDRLGRPRVTRGAAPDLGALEAR